MIPRNLFRQIVFGFFLALIVIGFSALVPRQHAFMTAHPNQGTRKVYCASDLSGPVVYFSSVLDANSKARAKISTQRTIW